MAVLIGGNTTSAGVDSKPTESFSRLITHSTSSHSHTTILVAGVTYAITDLATVAHSRGKTFQFRIGGALFDSIVSTANEAYFGILFVDSNGPLLIWSGGDGEPVVRRLQRATNILAVPNNEGAGRPSPAADTITHVGAIDATFMKRRVVAPVQTKFLDIVEFYDDTAAKEFGSQALLEAYIQNSIDITNAALRNSAASDIQLRLLRMVRLSASLSGLTPDEFDMAIFGPEPTATQLALGGWSFVGFLGVKIFVRDGPQVPGFAYRPGSIHVIDPTYRDPFAIAMLVGFNLGGNVNQEDVAEPPGYVDPYPYARATYVPNVWYSIMSNPGRCSGCVAAPIFSTPARTYLGFPQGTPDIADNVRAFRVVAPTAASRSRDYPKPDSMACTTAVDHASVSVPAIGGVFSVKFRNGVCHWTVRVNTPYSNVYTLDGGWITLMSSPTGTGDGEVVYSVAPNGVWPRIAYITVGNAAITITQLGMAPLTEQQNGTFSNGLEPWALSPRAAFGGASMAADATSSARLGSVQLDMTRNYFPNYEMPGNVRLYQCIAGQPGTQYEVRGKLGYVQGDDVIDAPPFISVMLFASSDCTGDFVAWHPLIPKLTQDAADRWYALGPQVVAVPEIARSVLVELVLQANNRTARFDDVIVQRVSN